MFRVSKLLNHGFLHIDWTSPSPLNDTPSTSSRGEEFPCTHLHIAGPEIDSSKFAPHQSEWGHLSEPASNHYIKINHKPYNVNYKKWLTTWDLNTWFQITLNSGEYVQLHHRVCGLASLESLLITHSLSDKMISYTRPTNFNTKQTTVITR